MGIRLSLILFIVGVLCIVSGYTQQKNPECERGSDVRVVPRNVSDQILLDTNI